MDTMWGEATASSAAFYEKVLRLRTVQDLFIIRQQRIPKVRERYFARMQRRLAKNEFRRHYD